MILQEAEKKIIEAARHIFHTRGFDGARMQEIADEAKINKAMLHYYFRSKDALFEAVFKEAAMKIFPVIIAHLESDLPLEEKIKAFVHNYIEFIKANPFMPGFVIHEITQNPARFEKMLSGRMIRPEKIIKQIQEGIDAGKYIPIAPGQLVVSVIAMCVFPFVAKPMVKFALNMGEQQFNEFIDQRKAQITEFILNGIRKK